METIPFEIQVFTKAFRSLEATIGHDPIGPLDWEDLCSGCTGASKDLLKTLRRGSKAERCNPKTLSSLGSPTLFAKSFEACGRQTLLTKARLNNRQNTPTLFDEAAISVSRKSKSKKRKAAERFFEEQKQHSIVKTRIVAKYFPSWLRIIKPRAASKRIAYIDLYSGPGVYDDGGESTPMLVMKHILADPEACEIALTFFSDIDADHVAALEKNLQSLSGTEKLKYQPVIMPQAAGESDLPQHFSEKHIVPTLMFLDPCGYHGVTLKLIRAILKDFGCEVILFFNFKRIIAAIKNDLVRDSMDALFGHNRVDQLNTSLRAAKRKEEKEAIIKTGLNDALQEIGGKYVEWFRFRSKGGSIFQHLVFITKNDTAQRIMKEIMAGESSWTYPDGVASFEYHPNPPSATELERETLFGHDVKHRPSIPALKELLLQEFDAQSIAVEDVYKAHNYGTDYVAKNYRVALGELHYDDGRVTVTKSTGAIPTASNRKQRHMADSWVVAFTKPPS